MEQFLVDGVEPARNFCTTISAIPTKIIGDAIDSMQPNRVLNRNTPLIDPSKVLLPRATRPTLTQLRSGHCAWLRSYLFRIGRVDSDLCPECGGSAHTVSHLFSCPSHPTNLTVNDLWSKPWDASVFLSTHLAFNFLPSPGPPPSPHFRSRQHPPHAPPN